MKSSELMKIAEDDRIEAGRIVINDDGIKLVFTGSLFEEVNLNNVNELKEYALCTNDNWTITEDKLNIDIKDEFFFIIDNCYDNEPIGLCYSKLSIQEINSDMPDVSFIRCSEEEAQKFGSQDILPANWKIRKKYKYEELI